MTRSSCFNSMAHWLPRGPGDFPVSLSLAPPALTLSSCAGGSGLAPRRVVSSGGATIFPWISGALAYPISWPGVQGLPLAIAGTAPPGQKDIGNAASILGF